LPGRAPGCQRVAEPVEAARLAGRGQIEAQTVQDYANYVLSTAAEGGQTLLEALDYEPLPKALDKEAVTGIAGIG
jgi:hypothetical protein